MGRPGPQTQTKRNRERMKQERFQEKNEKRELRKEEKKERAKMIAEGIDPDLHGIVAGPQAQVVEEEIKGI